MMRSDLQQAGRAEVVVLYKHSGEENPWKGKDHKAARVLSKKCEAEKRLVTDFRLLGRSQVEEVLAPELYPRPRVAVRRLGSSYGRPDSRSCLRNCASAGPSRQNTTTPGCGGEAPLAAAGLPQNHRRAEASADPTAYKEPSIGPPTGGRYACTQALPDVCAVFRSFPQDQRHPH